MKSMFVLATVAAAASAAPSQYAAAPLVAAAPLGYAAQYAAAPVAYAAPAPVAVAVPAPYSTKAIHGADSVTHSQAPAVITKSLSFGTKDFVSGYASAIHKPAIPDFKIAVPTALKGTVSHNAPIVKIQKEIHAVNEPVPVLKEVQVPYDVPVYKEQIIEVPQAVPHIKPVPVHVPYKVQGKHTVITKQTAPVVHRTHSHHVAQPAIAVAQPAVAYAQHGYTNAGYGYANAGYANAGVYAHQPTLALNNAGAYAYAQPAVVAAQYE